MLFSKPSKKTRKEAEETAAVSEIAASAETSKPRSTRSSKSKSSDASETGSVKHRKAATKATPAVSETTAVETPLKAMTIAASASQPVAETEIRAAQEPVEERVITREQIAALAHSYWVARGHAQGSAEQDWLRAERELASR